MSSEDSKRLVGLQPSGKLITSVSSSDHPLAAASTTTTARQLPVSVRQEPSLDQISSNTTTTTTTTNRTPTETLKSFTVPSVSVHLPPPPPSTIPKALVSPPHSSSSHPIIMSVDEMADAFLRSNNENSSPEDALLRPAPLPPVETDLERIRILVERRAWGDVLSVTSSLLKGPTSHYAPIYTMFLNKAKSKVLPTLLLNPQQLDEFVEILILQAHCWIQMRRFKELANEIQEWSFYCIYNKPGQSSEVEPWLPWSVHIFAAASLQFTSSDKSEALTCLWNSRNAIEKGLPDTILDLIYVDQVLSNLFCAQGKWRMALQALERLQKLLPRGVEQILGTTTTTTQDDPNNSSSNRVSILIEACRCEIFCRQGRILLQAGALEGAQTLLERAATLLQGLSLENYVFTHHFRLEQLAPQIQTNFGLLHFAKQEYNVALEYFHRSLELMDRSSSSSSSDNSYSKFDWLGGGLISPPPRHILYSETTTNVAVTALYTCHLQEAVHVMERLIRRNPSLALTERSALNLCTLYELNGDAASATRKKRTLQLIAKRFFLHDIGLESFRL